MSTKKRISLYICLSLSILILYIFLAAKPLTKEYQYIPNWQINISMPTTEVTSSKDNLYFKLGQTLGYFSENGEITHYKSFPSKAAISPNYYALYSSNAKDIPFFDTNGNQVGVIQAEGYPMFDENRIFVFLPGGTSFARFNEKGELMWKNENISPITAFSTNKNFTAAGYANGQIKVFNTETGNLELAFEPGGSDFPIILGLDISTDGKYIASLSGHNRQRFVLAKIESKQPKIIFHNFMKSELSRRTLVYFSEDEKNVFYNFENGIGIYNIETEKQTSIPVNKKIISIEESNDFTFLLAKKDKEYTVYIVEKTNILEGSFSFAAETAFINATDDTLYIGKDSNISSVKLQKS